MLLVGVAEVELDPVPRRSTVARVLSLEAAEGPYALVLADLGRAEQAVRDAVEQRTGLRDRLVLACMHPDPRELPDLELEPEAVVDPIVRAVRDAATRRVSTSVGMGRATADAALLQEARVTDLDPRVRALAFVGPDGPLAVLGFLPRAPSTSSEPGWPGVATSVARRAFGCTVALCCHAGEDSGVRGRARHPRSEHLVGRAMGRALSVAAGLALASAAPVSVARTTVACGPSGGSAPALLLGRHLLVAVPGEWTTGLDLRHREGAIVAPCPSAASDPGSSISSGTRRAVTASSAS